MKDQVTSIEQSKRLIGLGVPAERASMVWHRMFRDKKTGYTEWALKIGPIQKFPQLEVLQIIPAFTVADLLEVLPKAIWDDVKGWSRLVVRFRSKGFPRVGYEAEQGIMWSCGEVSLLGDIIETIDWVVATKHELNL